MCDALYRQSASNSYISLVETESLFLFLDIILWYVFLDQADKSA